MKLKNRDDSPDPETTKTKFTWMEIYCTFVAAFAFLTIGLLRAYTSPAISSMRKNPEIFNTTTVSEKEVISWIASSPPLASFIGTIISGPLLQYCGRQKTLVILTLPLITGWLLIGFAINVVMVMTGRVLTGLAAGISTAAAQLYVSECVRPEVRGTLGFLPSMMLALGVLVGFSASTIDVEWRELAFIMGSFPVMLFFMAVTVPESPPYLIMNGKIPQAIKSLTSIRGSGVEKGEIEEEVEALKDAINQEKRGRRSSRASMLSAVVSFGKKVSNFWKLLKKRQIWLPAFIAVSLMMFQQFAGANVIIYFLSLILINAEPNVLKGTIFQSVSSNSLNNFSDGDSIDWNDTDTYYDTSTSIMAISEPEVRYSVLDHNVGSVIVALVQFLAFFLSLPLIDRMGRKILLIISANLMALSLGVLGFYFYCNANSSPTNLHNSTEVAGIDDPETRNFYGEIVVWSYSWLPLTCLSVFIASYSIGFGPVPFIIMSEIFPAQARSYLCSLTSFSNHFFLFVVIKMYPIMVDWIGNHWTFWIFAGTSLLSIFLVVLVLPETKGKTLTEIEKTFTKETKPLLLLDRRDSYAVGLP